MTSPSRRLSVRDRWLLVAEHFATVKRDEWGNVEPQSGRAFFPPHPNHFYHAARAWGLCMATSLLVTYWWPETREGDDCRVLAACFLAAMSERAKR